MLFKRASYWIGSESTPTLPDIVPIDIEFEHDLSVVRLLGTTRPLWNKDQLYVGTGNIRDAHKYRLGPWIHHLAWVAATGAADARTVLLFGRLKQSGEPDVQCATLHLKTDDDPRVRAKEILRDLLELYLRGTTRPTPLFQSSSFMFAKRSVYYRKVRFRLADLPPSGSPPDEDLLAHLWDALSKSEAAFDPEVAVNERSPADLDDPYVARVWAGFDPIHDSTTPYVPVNLDFARSALKLWQPLLEGWSQEGEKPTIFPRSRVVRGAR